jgi:type I restriction enzyme S subunit
MSEMNFLERLLDGAAVEWKPLGDACLSILAGGDLPEKYLKGQNEPTKEFAYPIYSNGIDEKSIYGYTNGYRVDAEAVTISARGTIGWHTVRQAKFTPIVRLIVLIPNTSLLTAKFLNYVLDVTEIGHSGGSIPQLTVPNVKKILIPIPPFKVQAEIVRILDTFTELTAELSDRKKQYEYYRDRLLTFEEGEALVMQLSQCCVSIADGDHQAPPKTNTGIPFITISNVSNSHQIDFINTKFVSEAYYSKLDDKRRARKNDILYTVVGSFGIPVFINDNRKFTFQRHIAILRPNGNVVIPKYLYHVLRSPDFLKQAHVVAVGAAQKTITLAALNRMKVPVPSLAEQARIVAILDKFDTLTTSISEGLPREIALRQQQYEYYRDLLLSFPKPALIS